MKYNVIIIGAGPAGSHLGKILASNGIKVLIVDKRKEIGSPIRCGEAIGYYAVEEIEEFELPKNAVRSLLKGVRLHSPSGLILDLRDKAFWEYIVERKIFDKELAKQAVLAGAELRAYTIAKDLIFEGKKPVGLILDEAGEEKRVYADLIVSAEGLEASIARKIGLIKPLKLNEVGTAYEYEMHMKNDLIADVYFGRKTCPQGYLWIFPKDKNTANVGLGINGAWDIDKMMGADPKAFLDKFLKNKKQIYENKGGVISLCKPADKLVSSHFMVIGTAARQVDPLHGGGIALALKSAVICSRTILKIYKQKKEFTEELLREYEKEWKNSEEYEKIKKRMKVKNIMMKISDEDLDSLFGILKENEELLGNNKFTELAVKIIKQRPNLLLLLKDLI